MPPERDMPDQGGSMQITLARLSDIDPAAIVALLTHPLVRRHMPLADAEMSLDEAREQIQILGYDYLLFHNTDTRSVNLLIRLDDGNFELVQSRPV